jgi:hypothetical protein
MLTSPPFLKLGWREIAQRGVGALVQVDVVQEPAQLADSISIIIIVRQVNFFLFDGPDEPLCATEMAWASIPVIVRRLVKLDRHHKR